MCTERRLGYEPLSGLCSACLDLGREHVVPLDVVGLENEAQSQRKETAREDGAPMDIDQEETEANLHAPSTVKIHSRRQSFDNGEDGECKDQREEARQIRGWGYGRVPELCI
jgi:hypothetical protein